MGALLPMAAKSTPPPKPPEISNSPQRSFAAVARAPSELSIRKSCVDDPLLLAPNRMIQPKKVEIYKGKRSIFLPDDEVSMLLKPFKLALVCKFSHGCPKLNGLALGFRSIGLRGKYTIGHLDPKHVLITCTVEEDYSLLWLRREWRIGGFPMRVLKWSKSFKTEEESPVVPVWISIPMPPAYFFSKELLVEIAKMIGKPLRVDEATTYRTKPGIARICVEINVMEKLQDSVVVRMSDEDVHLSIIYEKIPIYCTTCKHLGHGSKTCDLNAKKTHEDGIAYENSAKGNGKDIEERTKSAKENEQQVFDEMPEKRTEKDLRTTPLFGVEQSDVVTSGNAPLNTLVPAGNRGSNTPSRLDVEHLACSNRFNGLVELMEDTICVGNDNSNDGANESNDLNVDGEVGILKAFDVVESIIVSKLDQNDNEVVILKSNVVVADFAIEQSDNEVSVNDGDGYVGGNLNVDHGGVYLNIDEGDENSRNDDSRIVVHVNNNEQEVVEEEKLEEGEITVNDTHEACDLELQMIEHVQQLGAENQKDVFVETRRAFMPSTDDVFQDIVDTRAEHSDSECQRHIDFDLIDYIIINDSTDDRGMQSDSEWSKKTHRVFPNHKFIEFGQHQETLVINKQPSTPQKSTVKENVLAATKEPKKKNTKKEKKAAKDPNKPKRAPSAFFVFMEDFRKQYKESHPNNKSVAAVGKAGGDMWKSLSAEEKAPFQATTEKHKAEYERKMEAYNKKLAGEADEEYDKSKSEEEDGRGREEDKDDD